MSTIISNTRTLVTLPLTIAVSAALLTACSNTSSVSKPVVNNRAPVVNKPVTPRPTSRPIQPVNVNTPPPATSNNAAANNVNAYLDEESLDELANLLEATDMTMVEDNQLAIQQFGDLWDRLRAGYRMNHGQYGYNNRIEAQKSWFISRQDYLNRLAARSSRYLYHTIREAERRNIPAELALLPVIESSYDPSATSNAAAAGLWQFIPSTGRIYGLSQSSSYDGRRDVIESTRAAYDFLTALHNQFGSWELALAAYNAGPGRIQKAIDYNAARGLPTDFWSLNLPTETMNYVPRFLAVADIVSKPSQYGVYLPAIANRQHFRSVPVNYGVSLSEVSQVTGVSYDELQKLNPALLAERIDATGPQRVVIPNDVSDSVDRRLSTLKGYGTGSTMVATNQPNPNYNTSYNGALPNSSTGLAEYASSANVPNQTTSYIPPNTTTNNRPVVNQAQLQSINNQLNQSNNLPTTSAQVTSNNTIIQEPPLTKEERDFIARQIQQQTATQEEVVSPIDGNIKLDAVQTQQSVLAAKGQEKKLSFASPANSYANNSQPKGRRTTYTVQRGDTLINIANRAGLKWRDIAEWNQIDPNATLLAGSVLYLYNARPIQNNQQINQNSATNRPDSYIVQEGDTLIGTANRVGLSVSELASYNNLSTNANLIIGQKLWLVPGRVSSSSASSSNNNASKTYQVRRGDSLIALSRQLGVSVEDLAALNNISSNAQLYTGQQLRIPASANLSALNSSNNSSDTSSSNRQSQPSRSQNNNRGNSEYEVQAGDTLIGIANKLGLDAEQIAAVNNFGANARLQRGATIKLPVSQEKVDIRLNEEDVKYKVQSGDTLIGVAKRYGVSVSALAAANGISTNANLIRGRTITIPAGTDNASSSAQSNTSAAESTSSSSSSSSSSSQVSANALNNTESYKVQSGDTLIGLSKRYNVSTTDLATLNNISSRAQLQRGQTLQVPKLTLSYKVRSGDSLIGLARKYGISPKELADMNDLPANAQLLLGQTLVVPNN